MSHSTACNHLTDCNRLPRALTALPLLVCCGCAAILAPKSSVISVTSEPSGAAVMVDGVQVGESPISVDLGHDSDHTIVLRKEGYDASGCRIGRTARVEWVLLDVFALLFVGLAIDGTTGDWDGLSPNECNVVLTARVEVR